MRKFCASKLNMAHPAKIKPILFDVSLRDGIQSANPHDYSTVRKIELLHGIAEKYAPQKLEIGSFVSPKVLPIMADTPAMFDYARKIIYTNQISSEIYALVPNKKGLLDAIRNGVRNFSFITSVSKSFQIKNTQRDLEYKKTELQEMMSMVSNLQAPCKTKLYVSCINECPISGLLDKDFIIYEILSSYGLNDLPDVNDVDEICLSDTMGTLKSQDFSYIVEGLTRFGLATNRISIHLHIDSANEREAKNILFECFNRGINKFDVSAINEGGCSVTMSRDLTKPNMTYEFFYAALTEYEDNNDYTPPKYGL